MEIKFVKTEISNLTENAPHQKKGPYKVKRLSGKRKPPETYVSSRP